MVEASVGLWTEFGNMTGRNWPQPTLVLLVVPLALVVIGFLFSVQQDARQQRIEDQRAEAERELAEHSSRALTGYMDPSLEAASTSA